LRPSILLLITISLVLLAPLVFPSLHIGLASAKSQASIQYVLVGGQNGTWFEPGQSPRLYQIFLNNHFVTRLKPPAGGGTVWSGGWSGSQWLISGWGSETGPDGSNPYLYLYDGRKQIATRLNLYKSQASWHGGDVFAASHNGQNWLLSGLGSDKLSGYRRDIQANHMSLAIFDGSNFTDLSGIVPRQHDAILYTNAWNGEYWLVGGGYKGDGMLFTFDGSEISDLSAQIRQAIPSFGSVQSLAWNGQYWLVGGVGFLAEYNGHHFIDLTSMLRAALSSHTSANRGNSLRTTVNALAWNGSAWLLGGGTPVAQLLPSNAWVAVYKFSTFLDLSSLLPHYVTQANITSSVLTIAAANQSWVIGGFIDKHGMLLTYDDSSFTDISSLTDDMSYINWVGVGRLVAGNQNPTSKNVNSVLTTSNPIISLREPQGISLVTVTAAIVATIIVKRFGNSRNKRQLITFTTKNTTGQCASSADEFAPISH
jgi:hypothetical protein